MERATTESEIVTAELTLAGESIELSRPPRYGSALGVRLASSALAVVPQRTQVQLLRMFANPSVLEKQERADLVRDLRACVKANPQVSDFACPFRDGPLRQFRSAGRDRGTPRRPAAGAR